MFIDFIKKVLFYFIIFISFYKFEFWIFTEMFHIYQASPDSHLFVFTVFIPRNVLCFVPIIAFFFVEH